MLYQCTSLFCNISFIRFNIDESLIMIVDLILRTILTAMLYVLANYKTYTWGKEDKTLPLKDVFHDILPDWSRSPDTRDYILSLLIVPINFLPFDKKLEFFLEFWEYFLQIITFKAIAIFFTQLPSSNQYCHINNNLKHCYHQSISGHNSFVFLLFLMYARYGLMSNNVFNYLPCIIYALLVLATRAHYTLDIIESFIVVYLLVH